jgi:tetratricopeptide (TPR) repeat protein
LKAQGFLGRLCKSRLLRKLKRPREAETVSEQSLVVVERAIRLNLDNVDNYITKGKALYDLKRYEQALTAYDHALQLNARGQDAHRGKIHALLKLKRYKESLAALKQSLYWLLH